ncbi:MAG: hypothetical protein GX333_06665 [Syntrophomonadaceae bacterium]|nr:hypothetical protein [Syntrophomonadaceae bacterium]
MKLRFSSFVAVVVLFVFSFCLVASANPTIIINGQVKDYNPPAEIKDDRVMLPLRYVIEDEVFAGEVFWDSLLNKVALNCQGKYIELFINDSKAKVNGEAYQLDTSPYIKDSRTYIPLRFISELLGAKVDWDSDKGEVNIKTEGVPLKKPIIKDREVFAYYYYQAFAEFKQNAHLFDTVSFRWFETNYKGDIYYEYQDDYRNILKFADEKGIAKYASVVLMDTNALHTLLSVPQNRARFISNILEIVKRDNYDGVDIDFEFINPKDGIYFTLFLKELKAALGNNIPLSVAVFARTGHEQFATPYEYQKIGQIVDKVIVMAYDYSYPTSKAGPVAPLWWVEEVANYMANNIPPEKVMLGLPTYGYDWANGGKGTTVTASRLASIKAKYRLTANFDYNNMSPYYTYYDEWGNYHQIWTENEPSLKEKLKVAEKYGLGGISFWRIGNGFNDLYNLLGK